jgi:DHA1 family multidrug resistance protein-like MFS transporter
MKSWKGNLAATAVAQFLCIVGWNAAIPFMPLYIRELGVTGAGQVELWSGLLASATPVAALFALPLWGVMADRKGHKWNTERAAFGIALTFTLMAFASNVQQLFVVRIFQGALAGITPAIYALISAFVPLERVGYALGIILMATYAGSSVGPLAGGFLADLVGYRWAFVLSGAFSALSGLVVMALVRERFQRPVASAPLRGVRDGARVVAHSMPVLGAILIMAGANLADSVGRVILPLFVDALQRDPARVNSATGLVLAGAALTSAVSALLSGRLADRAGYRGILLACAAGAAVAYVGQAAAPNYALFLLSSLAMGLFVGGVIPAANAILARRVNREQQGAVYGLSASANSAGSTLGPMIGAGLAAALGMRATFAAAGVLFVGIAIVIAATIRPLPHRQTLRLHHVGLRLPDSFFHRRPHAKCETPTAAASSADEREPKNGTVDEHR